MSVTEGKFDDNLFEILKECKTLPKFFDVVFGFLKRRTDFYHIAENRKSPVGLPPGYAENIVRQTFYKWEKDEEKKIIETKIVTKVVPEKPSQELPTKDSSNTPTKPTFTPSESYNGANYGTYSWSQTISDLDIIIKIPEKTLAKQIDINLNPQSISIKTPKSTLLDGPLPYKVKHKDAIWSIVGDKLEIHLDKSIEVWWDRLITSEEKLDLSKMDCSRPYEELSDEAKAKIEELQWNQERKRMGLSTSQEIQMENTLKKAWSAEGSPFSGPFDLSNISMN